MFHDGRMTQFEQEVLWVWRMVLCWLCTLVYWSVREISNPFHVLIVMCLMKQSFKNKSRFCISITHYTILWFRIVVWNVDESSWQCCRTVQYSQSYPNQYNTPPSSFTHTRAYHVMYIYTLHILVNIYFAEWNFVRTDVDRILLLVCGDDMLNNKLLRYYLFFME